MSEISTVTSIGFGSLGSTVGNVMLLGLAIIVAGTPLLLSKRIRSVFEVFGFSDNWKVNYVTTVAVASIFELVLLLSIFVAGDQLFSTPRPAPGIEDTIAEDRFLVFGFSIGLAAYLGFLWILPMVVMPRVKKVKEPLRFDLKTKFMFAGAIIWFQISGFWILLQAVGPA